MPLQELILDDAGIKYLNRLWDEFEYISDHTARTWDQYYFNQSGAIDGKGAESGRERPPDKKVSDTETIFDIRDAHIAKAGTNAVAIEAVNVHFGWVNDTLRRIERMRIDAEPHHLDALTKFAARAYRRPLTEPERDEILSYYKTLRTKDGGELSHRKRFATPSSEF